MDGTKPSEVRPIEKPFPWKYVGAIILWLIVTIFAISVYGQFANNEPFNIFIKNPDQYRQNYLFLAILVNVAFYVALASWWVFREKLGEVRTQNRNAFIQYSGHERKDYIRKIAVEEYGLILGKLLRSLPEPAHGEASAVPHSVFYNFEVVDKHGKKGIAQFKENYINKPTLFLIDISWVGRETLQREWTGESKEEPKRALMESGATAKKKDLNKVVSAEEFEEERSATE